MNVLVSYWPALPEIVLSVGAMALLMLGAFSSERSQASELPGWLAILILALAALAIVLQPPGVERLFEGAFVVDGYARFAKLLILAGSAAAILLSFDYFRRTKVAKFEIPVLILLAVVGMMMMVSASDLIALYLGLELQ